MSGTKPWLNVTLRLAATKVQVPTGPERPRKAEARPTRGQEAPREPHPRRRQFSGPQTRVDSKDPPASKYRPPCLYSSARRMKSERWEK